MRLLNARGKLIAKYPLALYDQIGETFHQLGGKPMTSEIVLAADRFVLELVREQRTYNGSGHLGVRVERIAPFFEASEFAPIIPLVAVLNRLIKARRLWAVQYTEYRPTGERDGHRRPTGVLVLKSFPDTTMPCDLNPTLYVNEPGGLSVRLMQRLYAATNDRALLPLLRRISAPARKRRAERARALRRRKNERVA